MEAVMDFLRAALPWIVVGLTLAVFFVKNAGKKKKKENTDNYGAEGMSLGMCFGTAIGASLHNIGLGISLGMLIGLAIGTCMRKEGQGGENAQEE